MSGASDSQSTTKCPDPSSRAHDYLVDVGSKVEIICGICTKMHKAPAGKLLNTPNCQHLYKYS